MRKFVGTVCCVLILLTAVYADQHGQSTPAERARAMEVIQKLEVDPMDPSLAKDREWVHEWVLATPDVHVTLCTAIIKPLLNEQNSDPRKALMLQNLLAMAAFEMRSPEKAKDAIQMQMAGAEGMIRAYSGITRRMPSYKSSFMEDLRVKQETGKLEAFVREGAAECRAHGGGTLMKP